MLNSNLDQITAANTALIEKYVQCYNNANFEGWLDLWHPEGKFVVAYGPQGQPITTHGSDKIVLNFKGLAERVRTMQLQELKIHQTVNPEVVFVLLKVYATLFSGDEYRNDLVWQITIKDGRLVEKVAYLNTVLLNNFFQMLADENRTQ